jgi:hypothetical protein
MKSKELRLSSRAFVPVLLALLLSSFFSLMGCGKRISAPAKKSQSTGTAAIHALPAAGLASADSDSNHVEVTFTRALLVVRDVRFAGGGGENGAEEDTLGEVDDDSLDNGGGVVFRGPFVIDLLSHHADSLDTELVPPGVYNHVQGHLQALHAGDAVAIPDLSFLIGSTVYFEGTISGEGGGPFTYQARIDDEFIIHGVPTVVTDTPATAFLVFNLDEMLVDREGRFLDPRDPANDPAVRSAIRHAIKIGAP